MPDAMFIRSLIALCAVALCAGCASTPQATPERDAEARRFEPVTREAVIYIYRPGIALSGPETTLWVDNRLVGTSLPGTFFRVIVRPGEVTLYGVGYDQGSLPLRVKRGESAFVALNVVNGRSQFRQVAPDEGRRVIRRCCALLETWRPGQRPLLR